MTEIPTIHYLNTDLDLICGVDPATLVAELESAGLRCRTTPAQDALWYVLSENDSETEPELNIVQLLNAIEALSEPSRVLWNRCSKREFNIGYECGDQPRSFDQGISNQTLSRMVKCGTSFRITVYPAES